MIEGIKERILSVKMNMWCHLNRDRYSMMSKIQNKSFWLRERTRKSVFSIKVGKRFFTDKRMVHTIIDGSIREQPYRRSLWIDLLWFPYSLQWSLEKKHRGAVVALSTNLSHVSFLPVSYCLQRSRCPHFNFLLYLFHVIHHFYQNQFASSLLSLWSWFVRIYWTYLLAWVL